MITKTYLQELSKLNNRADKADIAIRCIKLLKLSTDTKPIVTELEAIIHDFKVSHQIVLDYLFSFIPKELVGKLRIKHTSGADITDITSNIAFNAELRLHLDDATIHLKFDNERKCLYHQSWMEGDYAELLDKYLVNNSQFDAWIRHK